MAMRMGLLGKKLGMTQIFGDDGERIPVTVIQAGPCVVVGKRTADKDGYSALQIGFLEKPTRLANKPELNFFAKVGVKPQRLVRELRLPAEEVAKFEVGQTVRATDVFTDGKPVDITGTSKGKGYQGVMKLHKMSGFRNTHGTHEFFRHGGSIGCRLTPGRVHRGKRMSSHMGTDQVTLQNLHLVKVLADENCVLIRGAVPGASNDFVLVKVATKKTTYRKRGTGVEQERSKNPLKASKKAAAGKK